MNPLANLVDAVRAVVTDYREEVEFFPGPDDVNASVSDIVTLTRDEVDHDDIRTLRREDGTGPRITAELAAAYRQVLDADPDALRDAIFIAEAAGTGAAADQGRTVHEHRAVIGDDTAETYVAVTRGDAGAEVGDHYPGSSDSTFAVEREQEMRAAWHATPAEAAERAQRRAELNAALREAAGDAGERETPRPVAEYRSPAYTPAMYSAPAYTPAGWEAAAGGAGDLAGEREADLPDAEAKREAREQAEAEDEAEVAGDDAEAAADLDAACAAECASAAAATEVDAERLDSRVAFPADSFEDYSADGA